MLLSHGEDLRRLKKAYLQKQKLMKAAVNAMDKGVSSPLTDNSAHAAMSKDEFKRVFFSTGPVDAVKSVVYM